MSGSVFRHKTEDRDTDTRPYPGSGFETAANLLDDADFFIVTFRAGM